MSHHRDCMCLIHGPHTILPCSHTGEHDPKILEALKKFDHDGDGQIDAHEMVSLTQSLIETEKTSKLYRIAAIVMTIFTIILLAGVFGLTFAVVKILQDTQVR